MANGKHWEWRGFGTVSDAFEKAFLALPVIEEYASTDVEPGKGIPVQDEYLYIPHATINVKLRTGLGDKDGLKLKYFEGRDGELELWDEPQGCTIRLQELTPDKFTNFLGPTLHMKFPAIPSGPINAQTIRALFCAATPAATPVLVKKHRRTRRWTGSGQPVLVEIAEIAEPEGVVSVSLESDSDLTNAGLNELAHSKDSVLAALDVLKLRQEKLSVMSYLDALQLWANKDTVLKVPRS